MKTFIGIVIGLMILAAIHGCETTRGVGKDVENTGDNIQDGVKEITR